MLSDHVTCDAITSPVTQSMTGVTRDAINGIEIASEKIYNGKKELHSKFEALGSFWEPKELMDAFIELWS